MLEENLPTQLKLKGWTGGKWWEEEFIAGPGNGRSIEHFRGEYFVVVQSLSRVWFCNPMDHSTPVLPTLHYLPELAKSLICWCHPAILLSVTLFSCLQSFPATVSFPMSRLFASGGQSIGASASESVLPMNIQSWFPLGWTGLVSLLSKRLSRVFFGTIVWKHQFFGTQPSLWSNSHIRTYLLENHSFDYFEHLVERIWFRMTWELDSRERAKRENSSCSWSEILMEFPDHAKFRFLPKSNDKWMEDLNRGSQIDCFFLVHLSF